MYGANMKFEECVYSVCSHVSLKYLCTMCVDNVCLQCRFTMYVYNVYKNISVYM
jgi:hypothetical protein